MGVLIGVFLYSFQRDSTDIWSVSSGKHCVGECTELIKGRMRSGFDLYLTLSKSGSHHVVCL